MAATKRYFSLAPVARKRGCYAVSVLALALVAHGAGDLPVGIPLALGVALEALQACYSKADEASRAEEGAADARFHLAIAEASHNAVLLHTIRGLFDLLKRNVVTNIGGMYKQRAETRAMLISQHRELYQAIMDGEAELAREVSSPHILYVQEVLEEVQQQAQRLARAERRQGL